MKKSNLVFEISSLALLGILFLMPSPVRAEATKEFYSDENSDPANKLLPEAPNVFTWTANPNLNVTNDPATPEGTAVAATAVTGGAGQGWGIFTASPQNYSAYSTGALRFWLKSNVNLTIEIESSGVQKRSASVASTGDTWQEIVLPFSSFSANGSFNFAQVIGVIEMTTTQSGSRNWSVDHIRWTKPVASLAIFPTTTTVQQGKQRQFTVEGRDAAGETVIIYSTFSALASVGSFNPAAPTRVTASTFTANTSNGVATARLNAVSTQAAVSVVGTPVRETLGVYSETIANTIVLNTDSFLALVAGNAPVDESSADSPEGVKRFKTTVGVQAANAFVGWYIQWGVNGTPDTVVRDMNRYYDGSLRFWFKGPAALQNNMVVGIRSGNTTGGAELSKIQLKDYVVFDGTWRPVVIPMKTLAGARPWADIARTKVLFGIYAVGAVGSSQDYFVDNIRWDTDRPGALATIQVSPNPITVPVSSVRQFTAQGFDSNGVAVDVFPNWTISGPIGSITPASGTRTLLTAAGSPGTGTITATQGAVTGNASVTVGNIVWTQSYNVYSDNGSGGFVGVAVGVNAGTTMSLSEQSGGVTGDPLTFRRADYTLVNNAGLQDAFAVWFTNYDTGTGSRFMRYFSNGYLSFWVRTTHDLQVAVRSANIPAGTELSKFRLSELGIPADGVWRLVTIPLADFFARDNRLDFDQIQTYFAIGAISAHIGPVTAQTFDIDDVKWLTANPGVPDETKMYTGLKEMQAAGGLVRSFSGLNRAVTYDEALAAMNFVYRGDAPLAKNMFDVYKNIHDNYTQPSGPFSGFHDEYNINSTAGAYTIISNMRTAGPNAFMLLALIHYRNVTNQSTYDTLINDTAAWLLALQAGDGAIQFGRQNATLLTNKSTEHNFDCYAAFKAYAKFSGNNTYNTAAANILNWLQTQVYIPSQQRFKVGKQVGGSIDNWDRALDAYSWAPLALSSFTNVLATADTDFKNTKVCDLTGISLTGFDFSGPATLSQNPPGPAADKDAVWLEGTGQMALAYYLTGDAANGDFFMQQLDKAIVNTSVNGQGMAYATNGGTAYGFNMDSLNPSASAACWYLFARKKFNPFNPFPIYSIRLNNIATSVENSSMTWTVSVPARWVRSNQVLRLDAQPITIVPAFRIQIFTDNTNPLFTPRFADPTPGDTSNIDSNPVGLLRDRVTEPITRYQLNMAWTIHDVQNPAPAAEDPNAGTPTSFQWIYMKDRNTPAIPATNTTAFVEGSDDVTLRKGSYGGGNWTDQIQTASGGTFNNSTNPDFVYFEADFTPASAQTNYITNIIVEFLVQ